MLPILRVSRGRSAFTLIELLVVIAIIAILAAILFPVFGRAREMARRSSCLSNTKQINIALIQYTQDFDETLPIAFQDATGVHDVWNNIQPYVKSTKVLVCPSAKLRPCTAFNGAIDGNCPSYGYNFGPIQDFNNGAVHGGLFMAYDSTKTYFSGVPLASILAPSQTWAFGDARDFAFNSFSFNFLMGGSTDKTMTHGGRFSVAFVDGHSKSIQFRAGKSSIYPSEYVAVPSNPADAQGWCSDPNRIIYTPGGNKTCADALTYFTGTMTENFPQ